MSPELEKFIEENIDLIDQNTKESWEKIYKKLDDFPLKNSVGEFTKVILDAGINDPAEIMGHIPDHYLYESEIDSYNIPDNCSSIGWAAFYKCSSLTNISIPETVVKIESKSFCSCDNLTTVKLPNDLNIINSGVFRGCINLASIDIPKKVEIIKSQAFQYTNLTNVTIPENVKEIDSYAFLHCRNLTKVTINSVSLEYIGHDIFQGCSRLRKIYYNGPMYPDLLKLKGARKSLKIICTDGIM